MKRLSILPTLLFLTSWGGTAQAQSYSTADGQAVDFAAARAAHREVLFGSEAHVGRAALEQVFTLVTGSSWYWLSRELNSRDWDLAPTFENFGRRFTSLEFIRFDTNRFFVNQGHVLAGAIHYALPRANNFGVFASLATGIVTSALWEWVFEYREFISLNDLITSPYGGQPLGEVMFKFGELYNRQGGNLSLPAKALTFVFGQPQALHARLGDVQPMMPDEFGLAMSHDFRVYAGAMGSGATLGTLEDATGSFRLRTEVADMPGYQRAGTFSTTFRDGNFTTLDVGFLVGAKPSWKRFSAAARADLAGWYGQSIDEDGRGWSLELALGRGAWVETNQQSGLDDMIGMVDVVGPRAQLNLLMGAARLELAMGVYGDFGAVTSPAYTERAETFAPNTLRSELQQEGYYFGTGVTATPRARMVLGRWELGVAADASAFAALAGPDRQHHNAVPQPIRLRDQRTKASVDGSFRFSNRADVGINWARLWRSSALDGSRTSHTVDEVGAAVGYRF